MTNVETVYCLKLSDNDETISRVLTPQWLKRLNYNTRQGISPASRTILIVNYFKF